MLILEADQFSNFIFIDKRRLESSLFLLNMWFVGYFFDYHVFFREPT